MKRTLNVLLGVFSCICIAVVTFATGLPTKNKIVSAATLSEFISTGNEPSEYAYSFMVVGDTQIVNCYDPESYPLIYDYILDNVESKKVKHVFGLGDITDKDLDEEWARAKDQITRMDGIVSYSLIRGNHDMGEFFNASGFTDEQSPFDETFGEDSSYANQYVLNYKGTRNTAHEFSAGNFNYLVIALDFGPTDDVLEWANTVVEAYPNHNVIVTTHGYLNADGTFLEKGENNHPASNWANGGLTRNNGDQIWDKFVKKHANISMVLCGHVVSDDIVTWQQKGINGNTVTQMLINPQGMDADSKIGTTGMVATFYVSESGDVINVEYYSTKKAKYYSTDNQFTFTANVVEKGNPYVNVSIFGNGTATIDGDRIARKPLTADSVEIGFLPSLNYIIKKVMLNGVDITSQIKDGKYTLLSTNSNQVFFVEYAERMKYLLIEQNLLYKGKIIYSFPQPCAEFYEGATFSVSVEPNEGYVLKKITLNGVELKANSDNRYEIVIAPQDNILAVDYEENENQASTQQPEEDLQSSGCRGNKKGCNASLPVGLGGTVVCTLSMLLRKRRKNNDVI